jgi:outer membrane receptor protein involved in Fe transport
MNALHICARPTFASASPDNSRLNKQWAVQAVLNTSFLSSKSYGVNGNVTSSDSTNGVLSPTVSLIYKPIAPLTFYATYANSIEQSDQAPVGTANANQFLAPYHHEEYEAGVKYALSKDFLITLDGFQMRHRMPPLQTRRQTSSRSSGCKGTSARSCSCKVR